MRKIYITLMIYLITISIVSQFPFLLGNFPLKLILYSSWISVALIIFIKGIKFSPLLLILFALLLLLIIYDILLFIINGDGYINGYYTISIITVLFIYLLGYQIGPFLKEFDIIILSYTYILNVFILCLYIFSQNSRSFYEWSNASSNMYSSKNSLAPLLVFAIFLLLLIPSPIKNKFINKIKYFVAIFLGVNIFLLQTRSSIFSLIITAIIVMILYRKFKTILILACSIIVASFIPIVQLFWDKSLKIGEYQTGLNSFSSGRLDLYNIYLNKFIENPLFGNGYDYVDNFYLSVLVELGLIGASIIFIILFLLAFRTFRIAKLDNWESNLLLSFLSIAFIQSLFEGLNPIGPGVVFFYLWFMFGIIHARVKVKVF